MRTKEEVGGSAFPLKGVSFVHFGMTLRDWFAGQVAIQCISLTEHDGHVDFNDTARTAYELADAMIAERNKE